MVPNCGKIRKIEDSYTYDEWGNCSVVVNENNVANINPFRYRGYYYDTESGLYYLQGRYYDPSVGQFISPDTMQALQPNVIGGVDLYSYANNNSIGISYSSSSVGTVNSLALGGIFKHNNVSFGTNSQKIGLS